MKDDRKSTQRNIDYGILNKRLNEMLVLPIIRMTRSIIRITVIAIAIIIKIPSPMIIFPFVCVIFIVTI